MTSLRFTLLRPKVLRGISHRSPRRMEYNGQHRNDQHHHRRHTNGISDKPVL
jgi:hypothetical protein